MHIHILGKNEQTENEMAFLSLVKHLVERILTFSLELINEYNKVAGYKINTQQSLAFLYTNNEKIEREIRETIPFTIATKRIKYFGINLPKEIKIYI